jgi:outer membrane receptor protein involved in Fe transport
MFGKMSVFRTVMVAAVILAFFFFSIPLIAQEDKEDKDEMKEKTEELFKMSLEELMNIRVTTADRTAEKIADIPASVVLITRKDIEMYGYQTLTEILENIPGLYGINDYMKGGTNFGVRGFWSGHPNDNMIIMVNGVHQVYDILSNYQLNNIAVPVEAIERIEVIRGPMSVIYGNGAFYGAINIFTKKEIEVETKNIVSGSIGSQKTKKLFVRAENETDDFYYSFNASLYDTYGIDKPLSDMMSDPNRLLSYGLPIDSRTGGRLENNEKYLNFSGAFKDFFLDISYNETRSEFYFNLPSYSNGTYVKNNTTHISFGYNKELSNTLNLQGKFTYSKSRDSMEFDYLFNDFYGIQTFDTDAIELELDAFIVPSLDLKITTGLYYRAILNAETLVDIPSFGNPALENFLRSISPDDNIETRAIYTQVNYSPFGSLKLVAGIRMEQSPKYGLFSSRTYGTNPPGKQFGDYNREKIEIIPRFAAIYYLNRKNIFKVLFGKAINRPSFFQNSYNSLDPTLDDLKPESIQTLELNYIGTISSKLALNVSLFHNILENLITRDFEFNESTGYWRSWSSNAGKMITNGVELSLTARPIENLKLELSGTYQNTDDKRDNYKNIDVAYSPNFLGYLKASYHSAIFSLAVTGNYVGAMETFWDETIGDPNVKPISGSRIGDKVDGYFVFGANLRLEDLFLEGLYLNLRCSNLLDAEVRYPTFTNNPYFDRGTLGMGRSFLLTVGYKF